MESWTLGKVEDKTKYKGLKEKFMVALYGIWYQEAAKGKLREAWTGTRWYGMRWGVVDIWICMRGYHCDKGHWSLKYETVHTERCWLWTNGQTDWLSEIVTTREAIASKKYIHHRIKSLLHRSTTFESRFNLQFYPVKW